MPMTLATPSRRSLLHGSHDVVRSFLLSTAPVDRELVEQRQVLDRDAHRHGRPLLIAVLMSMSTVLYPGVSEFSIFEASNS